MLMNTYQISPAKYQQLQILRTSEAQATVQKAINPGTYSVLQLFGAAFSIGSFLGQQVTDQNIFSDSGFFILLLSAVSIMLGSSSTELMHVTMAVRLIQAAASAIALASLVSTFVNSHADEKIRRLFNAHALVKPMSVVLLTGVICGFMVPYAASGVNGMLSLASSMRCPSSSSCALTNGAHQQIAQNSRAIDETAPTAEEYLLSHGCQ